MRRRFVGCAGVGLVSAMLALPALAGDLVIAGYGDSLTGFQPSKWCGKVQAPHVCDPTSAVPGQRTAEGVAQLLADLSAGSVLAGTTHVALAWGTNDLSPGGFDWDAGFAAPLREAAAAVRDAGIEPVLFVVMDKYIPSPLHSPDECVPNLFLHTKLDAELSPRVYAIARDFDPPLIVVDLNVAYDALPEETKCPGAWGAGYYRDHVHQTDAGYQFMADTVVAAIVLPEPSASVSGPIALLLVASLRAARRRRRYFDTTGT